VAERNNTRSLTGAGSPMGALAGWIEAAGQIEFRDGCRPNDKRELLIDRVTDCAKK
jgi:hypothetical protein